MPFNYSEITSDNSIKVGSDLAPIRIVEYINLRCPDSRDYEINVVPYLESYIKEGKVQRIIKHFDKEVSELEKGNLMNQYINYDEPSASYQMIHKLFKEQDDWARNRISQIPHIALDYGLKLEAKNRKRAIEMMEEVKAVDLKKIPTVFIGEKAFVETIGLGEFKKEIGSLLL